MDRDTFKFNEHFIDKSEEILKWKHPFSCIVGGPSGCGKTSFVVKLIECRCSFQQSTNNDIMALQ